jgi:hypothetical protein
MNVRRGMISGSGSGQDEFFDQTGMRVLGVWISFCGAGGFETYGGGILLVVEGDAAIPGLSGPQREDATSHPKD